jgi:hypothetical protein
MSVRTFKCRSCKKMVESEIPPLGWLSLMIRQPHEHGGKNFDWTRRGLYCCLGCLEDAIPMLAGEMYQATAP